jgi:putative membrane protein
MKKIVWMGIFLFVFIWSAIGPKDRLTWLLEVLPAVIAIIVLFTTRTKFPLTPLAYILILVHAVILMIGGHYTYAEVPFGDLFSSRNNYDKLGHFAQGFVPALIAREILLRYDVVASNKWRNFFIVSICLAFSAFYELVEWWVALFTGASAEAFLGTQGYIWDTQSDMFLALLGAVTSLAALAHYHDSLLTKTHSNWNKTNNGT